MEQPKRRVIDPIYQQRHSFTILDGRGRVAGTVYVLDPGMLPRKRRRGVGRVIEFTVLGEPVAQGRPKFSTAGGFPRAYDPAKSRDYKDYVRLAAREYAPAALLEGPLGIAVTAYRSTPKSFSQRKAAAAERGEILPVTKPDADNYLKGVKDALKGVIWKDDSQVVDAFVRKRYSNKPRIEVRIKELS